MYTLSFVSSIPSFDIFLSCRWVHDRPASLDNLVLLTFEEAELHEADQSFPSGAAADHISSTLERVHHAYF